MKRALVVAAALLLVFPVSEAHIASSCGEGWTRATTCDLVFEGFPLRVSGTTESPGASVRVSLTVAGYPELVLVECSGEGSCQGERDVDGWPEIDLPPQIPRVLLRCYVEGSGPGSYSCSSGGTDNDTLT